ncbi:MAG: Crp/Fnr family transcriptional regulator [Streptosporangiales bacterium]|nr:Crp/Fnr family transcriptional regulator [Streptosporangiales bacterium]
MRESGFWGMLDDSDRAALKATARSRTFADKAILCLEGDSSTHVFILVEGWVKIITSASDGREKLAALRGDGDVVGDIAQVAGHRTATVKAIRTVRALIVSPGQFGGFLDSHTEAARAYRHVTAEHERAAHSAQRSMALASGPQRLAALLLELDGADLPLSQEELASLIGASRSTVTRALKDWRSRHIIATRQGPVTILDPAALRRLADG